MDVLEILAIVAAAIGIVGSIIPGIPGPPFSWVGYLLVYIAGSDGKGGEPMSLTALLVWLAVVIVVTILDYVLPARFTRLSGGHKAASKGAVIGLFAGMILTPVGMILGSMLGAFIAELAVSRDNPLGALKAALAAFLGFIATTGMKLIVCCIMAWNIVDYIFTFPGL